MLNDTIFMSNDIKQKYILKNGVDDDDNDLARFYFFAASPQDSTTLLAMQSVFQLRQSICNRLVSFISPSMTRPMISTFCSRWQWTRWVNIYYALVTCWVVYVTRLTIWFERDQSSQIRLSWNLMKSFGFVHSLFSFHMLWPWRNFDMMCLVKKSTRKNTTATTGC